MGSTFDLKSIDWRKFKKVLDPKAAGDLNEFLERLPHTAGQSALIAAGIAWMAAAALGLFTTVQVQKLIELRGELKATEALKPIIPRLRDVPVNPNEVAAFAGNLKNTYPDLNIDQRGPNIQIAARSTAQFGVFREAIGHVQNGGAGWRVNLDRLCVGRECDRNALGALLKINKVSVDKPS